MEGSGGNAFFFQSYICHILKIKLLNPVLSEYSKQLLVKGCFFENRKNIYSELVY
jgi:hypothetical protein